MLYLAMNHSLSHTVSVPSSSQSSQRSVWSSDRSTDDTSLSQLNHQPQIKSPSVQLKFRQGRELCSSPSTTNECQFQKEPTRGKNLGLASETGTRQVPPETSRVLVILPSCLPPSKCQRILGVGAALNKISQRRPTVCSSTVRNRLMCSGLEKYMPMLSTVEKSVKSGWLIISTSRR